MEKNNDIKLGDLVIMKKAHPCGNNKWEVIRTGIDIKIKCTKCERIIMMSYQKFMKGLKRKL